MTTRRYAELVEELSAGPGPVRLVGVDGLGGAGKTTFASRLASAADNTWPVVHTDDFASHDQPMQWWPRFERDVIAPLRAGRPATFRPYDWVRRSFDTALVTVGPADVVVIEGVGATQRAWRDTLALRIWVEAPRDTRLRRGIDRDGEQLREFWNDWMAAEDGYVAEEDPRAAADIVVDGAPSTPHGDDVFVVVSERRAGAAATDGRR